ncbi:midasin [Arthroderma uncinatum]|uniref:midasin n=1 Tax=Arthroderma uncinatum TaxID=74035 RepID=UPI00144A7F77|nr:midasin [Arthroderma uncinatum]KAF3482737.1 midasin [Arthroderma uncinatum]
MEALPVEPRLTIEPGLLQQLPEELSQIFLEAQTSFQQDRLVLAALNPSYTAILFPLLEPVFVDIAARWLSLDLNIHLEQVISAFSRILPHSPYLRPFAEKALQTQNVHLPLFTESCPSDISRIEDDSLLSLLLSAFRLLSFDVGTFSQYIFPHQLQALFSHSNGVIRCMAVRCFCLHIRAADAILEDMLRRYCGEHPLDNKWEGQIVDFRLISFWEEQRYKDLKTTLDHGRKTRDNSCFEPWIKHFRSSNYTAEIGGVLIPTVKQRTNSQPFKLVQTATVQGNLRKVGEALLSQAPLLLVGQPGAGKTSLVMEAANAMGHASSMITLHLNEQTDSKSLLGVYSTSAQSGSFKWQPGVLTQAAREGRWILIEDLDRAPAEVIAVILPLIENRELVIPSRRENIRCAEGFRIIATMRSFLNSRGDEVAPGSTMLGGRLWNTINVAPIPTDEISQIVKNEFPLLDVTRYAGTFLNLYSRVISTLVGPGASRGAQGRSTGLRDLMKFCNRVEVRLQRLGIKRGNESVPARIDDEIFLDAIDCFAAHIPNNELRLALASNIAEEMHIPPQKMRFCLQERVPTYSDENLELAIGREICQKTNSRNMAGGKYRQNKSFAATKSSLRLMEQASAALQVSEPILLVGETGIGKTAVVQQLAALLNQRLTVVNLSQQSEASDLLGGYKPVNLRSIAIPLVDEFNSLFESTFSVKKNRKFLSSVTKSVSAGNWPRLVNVLNEAVKMAADLFNSSKKVQDDPSETTEQPAKKRRLDSSKYSSLSNKWSSFASDFREFEARVLQGDTKFSFAFVQGKIVKALKNGEWVLLDEINLASPDTLESIASLLHHGRDGAPSVLLSEAGEMERVVGHPEFRIFGAMNPATDAGKRDLAPGLRSRFTELYVRSPDSDMDDLLGIIRTYLGPLLNRDSRVASDLANAYIETKKLTVENQLTDGAGHKPHFSIRTLVRTLMYVTDQAHIYGVRRATYEGFSMSFLTLLSKDSERLVIPLLEKHIFGKVGNARSILSQNPREVNDGATYVQYKHYWMQKGDFPPEDQPHYIITPFIERNLMNLVRASSTRRFPILLQGPTSSGKTSMVEHLAKLSGNRFVRINNHEHTDLQEYLGSYATSQDGTLKYQDGVLVEALKKGFWIVLDELNLAPTDVLEALNRLLDDNRELFVPETQEVIRPHPNFMLFATQNPAGLYGGRKVLSRAFRNRFLELHFDDIPEDELEFILKERSQIPPSFCTRIVSVYRQLSILRQSNRLFEQRNSFATLRDLFRWAMRHADDREQLAVHGFMLLAERVRNSQEREAVKRVIEKVMGVKLDETEIYGKSTVEARLNQLSAAVSGNIVWTPAMRRLFILVSEAIEHNEPVLLVGETGCGKTQICQAIAEAYGKELFTINAHVNLETGDLIGSQRPIRNRSSIMQQLEADIHLLLNQVHGEHLGPFTSVDDLKNAFYAVDSSALATCDPDIVQRIRINLTRANSLFEWSDGSLVTAMKCGQHFLLDELSLADDSVLERLNSVLETSRTVLLAEKGPVDSLITAADGFQFLGTMNPGGDYGKRELSAALRNRLTEIWVPELLEDNDILPILEAKVQSPLKKAPQGMVAFAKWFKEKFRGPTQSSISVRDLLAWGEFINSCTQLDADSAIVHGACLVYIDGLGANPSALLASSSGDLERDRHSSLEKLGLLFSVDALSIYNQNLTMQLDGNSLKIGQFSLPLGPKSSPDSKFALNAPTTLSNTVRVARGLQSSKPILLEGSPGVGKTTLVAALAQVIGVQLTRINLSEQTDLTDLFGSDVPVDGGDIGSFAWSDAPFLRAMQHGGWVLLDEMNLASQSVLEGLNSCLDHRQQVYIAELGQTFRRHPDFVLFAAQNPHHQGGGRKGLPASFVNRFTVVYADSFTSNDLRIICNRLSPTCPADRIDKLVEFTTTLNTKLLTDRRLGALGAPWEVNLRDISRWLKLLTSCPAEISPAQYLDVVISHRFRTTPDRSFISQLYANIFGSIPEIKSYFHNLSPKTYQVGLAKLERSTELYHSSVNDSEEFPRNLHVTESMMLCVENSWPCLLVGPSGCGKTSSIRRLAALSGAKLVELALNSDTDAMDLIGGFEQKDSHRKYMTFASELGKILRREIALAYAHSEGIPLGPELVRLYQIVMHSSFNPQSLLEHLSEIVSQHPENAFHDIYEQCKRICIDNGVREAGFEWTEGVLIHAMQQGNWVVLDNANLCNATVLDRLNSLLEPNGCLIVNERKSPDALAQVITPHPNFRLFLTVDPRHGELSRAMRNRSVEIYFLQEDEINTSRLSGARYLNEAAIYRIRECQNLMHSDESLNDDPQSIGIGLDHLSPRDLTYLHYSIKSFVQLWTRGSTISPMAAELMIEGYNTLLSRNALLGQLESIGQEGVIVCKNVDSQEKIEPLHPLINQPRLLSFFPAENSQKMLIKAAKLQELQLQIVHFYQQLSQMESTARNKKSSEMTHIERSMTSMTIQSHLKDSTQPVASFLYGCCSALNKSLETLTLETCSDSALQLAEDIIHFCWDVFRLTQGKILDNAVFLTYLLIGKAICLRFEHTCSDLQSNFTELLSSFNANWKLSTGESMQRMWDLWRPATPTNPRQLAQKVEFEKLRARYDRVALRSRVPIHELGRIYDSFLHVQTSILRGADSTALLPELNSTISHFKAQALKADPYDTPHFASEFETLCQYNDLLDDGPYTPSPLPGSIRLLAGRASRPNEISSIGSAVPGLLSKLTQYLGCQNSTCGPFALLGNISNSLVHKFECIGQVPLGQIDLLESEIGLLSEGLAANTFQLSRNQLALLQRQLAILFKELLLCHSDFIDTDSFYTAMQQLQELQPGEMECLETSSKWGVQNHPKFADHSLARHLLGDKIPSLLQGVYGPIAEKDAIAQLGELCVRLSIGLLHCYVPNRPFDPSLSLAIEHQQHIQRWRERSMKLDCLRACELPFSGQKSTLRIQAAEDELEFLSATPPDTPVTRPESSRLDNVQAQFTSILNSVLNQSVEEIISASCIPNSETPSQNNSAPETLLQLNIRQIVRRLSVNSPGYDDITILAIRFLQLLDQGIELIRHGRVDPTQDATTILNICRITPFLGPHLPDLSSATTPSLKGNQDIRAEAEIHKLLILGAAQNVDEQTLSEPVHVNILHGVLDRAYVTWKEKLEKDQSQELEKSKFYHYRGSFEDDEQLDSMEMLRLFPIYDNHDEPDDETPAHSLQTGDLRLKLFTAFKNLFVPGDKTLRLKHAVKEAYRLVGLLTHHLGLATAPVELKYHLAPVFLQLEDIHQIDKVNNYNFYTDPNTAEIKKFASLVQKVQTRFFQLQESWPEHATLTDVVNWCSKIFKYQHREPLAKFLTMAEKLHEHVHEWQTVASKEFSAIDCYNDLTSTLIHWRRLELSTWSRLLDVEDEKCQENAASWWYMAYEVIVAVPLQLIQDRQQLDSHVSDLLVTLEKFLHATPMGQFASRVDLIEKFKLLLLLYVTELPALKQVISALDNLLGHYRPFASPIHTSLQNGRQSLEKEIKEQVQLASWKDTNITALRESARRSHHSLFKIIRKYRRLLAQPCEELLSREIPGGIPESQNPLIPQLHSPKAVASAALNLYQKNGELWGSRPTRFQNPDSTARNMCQVYEGALPKFQAATELEGIMADVVMSISDFQKRTPKTLTKENKEEIQHLKAQKRSFYATKLKELRHMGLRSNLGTDLLDKQRSVSLVLATTSSFDFHHSVPFAVNANEYFHRFLHMVPSVRQAARNYSEDLSNVEAGRSAGFTEGFLYQMLRQRDVLSPALASLESLDSIFKLASAISSNSIIRASGGAAWQQQTTYRTLKWLPTIIELSSTILTIHGKHSNTGSSAILSSLTSWRERANSLQEQLTTLPILPRRLLSQSHEAITVEAKEFIACMKSEILTHMQSQPEIAFALKQLLLWTEHSAEEVSHASYDNTITSSLKGVDSSILTAMDKILVALQRVQGSISNAPISTDITAWLSKTDVSFSKSIVELHIDEISSTLRSIFDGIETISDPNDLDIAIAGVSLSLPVLEQYQYICSDLVYRYAAFHYTFCKFGYTLAKSFKQVASEGFCSPSVPSEQQGQSDKVESGTGLGDGEGAEDISKDIQDDEDLSELAQQKQEDGDKEDLEGTEDAVNMDHEELEGQEDEFAKEKEDGDEGESDAEEENDLDEEVGSVDGWDPSAVDEKLWDGANDKEQKDTENNDGKGDENTEEISAAAEERKDEKSAKNEAREDQDAVESDEDAPDDEQEGVGREDMDVTDPHAQENEVLDLPEDMDLDGEKKEEEEEGSDAEGGMSEISMEDAADQEDLPDDIIEQDNTDARLGSPDADMAEAENDTNEEGQAEEAGEQEQVPQQDDEEDKGDIIPAEDEQPKPNPDNTAPSDQVSAGVEHDQSNEKGSSGDAAIDQPTNKMEEDGEGEGDGAEEQGRDGKQSNMEAGDANKDEKQDPQLQAFKKLGDILEQWHRSHREILEASEQENEQSQEQDIGEKDVDFEHLADDQDIADTQALGQANEEQSQAMNQSKAIESDTKPQDNEYLPDAQEMEDSKVPDNLEDLMEVDAPVALNDQQQPASSISRPDNAMVRSHEDEGNPAEEKDDLDDVDTHLSIINLSSDSTPLTPPDEARRLWTYYESITHDLSLSLTEQLRLILAPTMATKLRGDFRTGKRLNIKRIIPYIASQYKRDKIWMRRSVPSKRNYQIMLAVDDSKSMLEGASGQLAFQTLALVARSLSMLESGDLCIVSFGNEEHIRVAHDFGKPFSSEAGSQVFQHFSYKQTGTNVRQLIADSMTLFREARAKRPSSSASGDLWQLELIISDGICEDHDRIARLVRQAHEERIMLVFIIVDAVQEESRSIMNLSQATFESDGSGPGDGKWKMKKYLDGFPFPYYLIVRNVQELPAVLSLALKQWFAEVVEVSS